MRYPSFCFWLLGFLLAALLLLFGACSKEKLEDRLQEQRQSFNKVWHPLDYVPQSSMSRATLALYRKTLLARNLLRMQYHTSTSSGRWESMQYRFYANKEYYDLLFSINNQQPLQLKSEDGFTIGWTRNGLQTGQNASIRFILDGIEIGQFMGRIPKRLEMEVHHNPPVEPSPFENNLNLTYTWETDPNNATRQLLVKLHFLNQGMGYPLQFQLIPDNGFFDIKPLLDTTSAEYLIITFSRFQGDLINTQLGFYFEFESTFEHNIQIR
ncbi:MAG: hypothetical protein Q8J69_11495 [Sphingobacteriaceae bacterium]|nr:hypothetical protein [Sphingobacteriaceae bacterium]